MSSQKCSVLVTFSIKRKERAPRRRRADPEKLLPLMQTNPAL
ncbi:hypothetical protein ACFOG5_10535 [Pedobacter fastidiosus]